ncbi:TlyA family RNA methyltransferase [Isoptericola sp. BMS4]|uniref:TlyA family RNA methyltransferase n=1 Tax=Isoptericola sp. BMS4 TaxID=2527875 RepID=UPI001423FB86|nr:TlyA family RNA methyltransferase [Isoptericola sp. BMS4]
MPDVRADVELVRRGLARSRRQAAELVAAGRVHLAGRTVAKPSAQVPAGATLEVAHDPDDPGFASRAGGKLAGALAALAAHPVGRALVDALPGAACLDLGASTGGFTDVLLRHGAAHVVALDVGHDQIVPSLRSDPRVDVVEGFNVRDLTPGTLDAAPDVVVGDLSFISLTLVVRPLASVLGARSHVLLLVKPQFEVGRERLGSGGVVRDPGLRADSVRTVVRAGADAGWRPVALVPSPVPGPSGNTEYFCWFVVGDHGEEPATGDDAVAAAAREAVAWSPPADGTQPGTVPAVPPVLPIGGAP